MRWAGSLIAVLGVSAFVTVARAEPLGARADLPVGIAAFPVEASNIAQARAVDAVAPAAEPPAAAPLVVPAPPVPAPPLSTGSPASAPPAPPSSTGSAASALPAPSAGATSPDCSRSGSTLELGAAALVAMIRDGKGLFAVLGAFGGSSDSEIIDDAAEREVKRLRLMHRLAAMREEESAREFSEKLTLFLRKRAFLEGLEARQQLAPSPFVPSAR